LLRLQIVAAGSGWTIGRIGARIWRFLFISFAIVTAVFFGHTSYRAYLDVYWIVFAAGMLAPLGNKYFPARMQAACAEQLASY
jgi:hypothetical protein